MTMATLGAIIYSIMIGMAGYWITVTWQNQARRERELDRRELDEHETNLGG